MTTLIVTANVGSLFEEYSERLQTNWLEEYKKLTSSLQPCFVAIHLQETGGKSQQVETNLVQTFFSKLQALSCHDSLAGFYTYIDKDNVDESKYTALSSCYFIHKQLIEETKLWNFKENKFTDVSEGILSLGEDCIRKSKYPRECFSKKTERWPRKGFTLTRWLLAGKTIDMLNIHLSHDACNVTVSLKENSKYSKYRRRALNYTLEQLGSCSPEHQILFGDFNVRPDTKLLIEHIMKNKGDKSVVSHDGVPSKVVYQSINGSTETLLEIAQRSFQLNDYTCFLNQSEESLLRFDNELKWMLEDRYKELPIKFIPTYPHRENPDEVWRDSTSTFSQVRCPSWCDRILFTNDLYHSLLNLNTSSYNIFGENEAIGDHKPVYAALRLHDLPTNQ